MPLGNAEATVGMLVLQICEFCFFWSGQQSKKNQSVGNEDITLCVKKVVYYRQFVSLEIYKIASTPFLGCGLFCCFFFLAAENPVLAFCALVAGQWFLRGDICTVHPTAAQCLGFPKCCQVLLSGHGLPEAGTDLRIYTYISEKGPFSCWLPHRGSASPPCHPLQNIHFDIGERFFKWAWPGGRSWHGASTLAANVFVEEW